MAEGGFRRDEKNGSRNRVLVIRIDMSLCNLLLPNQVAHQTGEPSQTINVNLNIQVPPELIVRVPSPSEHNQDSFLESRRIFLHTQNQLLVIDGVLRQIKDQFHQQFQSALRQRQVQQPSSTTRITVENVVFELQPGILKTMGLSPNLIEIVQAEQQMTEHIYDTVQQENIRQQERVNLPQENIQQEIYQPRGNIQQPGIYQPRGNIQQPGIYQPQENIQQPGIYQPQENIQQQGIYQPRGNIQQPGIYQPRGNIQQPGIYQPRENIQQPGIYQPRENIQQPGIYQPRGNIQQPGIYQPRGNIQQPGIYQPRGNIQQPGLYQPQENIQQPGIYQPRENIQQQGIYQPQENIQQQGIYQPQEYIQHQEEHQFQQNLRQQDEPVLPRLEGDDVEGILEEILGRAQVEEQNIEDE